MFCITLLDIIPSLDLAFHIYIYISSSFSPRDFVCTDRMLGIGRVNREPQWNFFLSHRESRDWSRRAYDYLEGFISMLLCGNFFSNLCYPTCQPPSIGDYWELALWLIPIEMDSNCTIHTRYWRLGMKQRISSTSLVVVLDIHLI